MEDGACRPPVSGIGSPRIDMQEEHHGCWAPADPVVEVPDPARADLKRQVWRAPTSPKFAHVCHRRRAVCPRPHAVAEATRPPVEHSRAWMEQPRPPPSWRSRSWAGVPELPHWGRPEDGGRDQIRAGDGRIRRREIKRGPQEPANVWHRAGKNMAAHV
ncbi:hypothetical protein SETIT_2G312400v2 [Setaria italica]|uniref:Uncharacterized protein n=1 Tax=Setaria italica TaxID=4555 RepID=A0A368Q5M8_SETIT|nr:hypothetical protein SETIT_2G312400v2 [Setaria italica]